MENELTNQNQSARDQCMKQNEEYQERIAQNNNNKMKNKWRKMEKKNIWYTKIYTRTLARSIRRKEEQKKKVKKNRKNTWIM